MTSNRPYLIRALFDWICDNGLTPYLLVDATQPGVRVPPQSVKDGRIVLNIAPRAITKLELANDVVSFQARFSGVAMLVIAPVDAVLAIYAMENGEGMMFPSVEATAVEDAGVQPVDVVGDETDRLPDDPEPSSGQKPAGKPHLRIIK
jgi:stringent starvation protein B